MIRCMADESISRRSIGAFEFPLGVYPVEPMTPKEGYSSEFEPADGADEQSVEVEPWPDRYMYDIVIRATRLPALWFQILAMMPSRVYPILDYIGHDAYREIDPFIAYEPVGTERIITLTKRFKDFFFEDGMVGFGAVSESPFFYAFVDEHKILTVRVESESCERVERLLAAFGLTQAQDPAGADAAAHEHRGVLSMPEDQHDLLGADEIIDIARDAWSLVLNIDPESNLDDDGKDLGITPWRCLVRREADDAEPRVAEVVCTAGCLREAEALAMGGVDALLAAETGDAPDGKTEDQAEDQAESRSEGRSTDQPDETPGEPVGDEEEAELVLVRADRLAPEDISVQHSGDPDDKPLPNKFLEASVVIASRWLEPGA